MKFEELAIKVFDIYYSGTPSERMQAINMKILVDKMGTMDIKQITKPVIDKLKKEFKELGWAAATINNRMSFLSKSLTYAAECRYIEYRPNVGSVKTKNGKIRWFTEAEEKQVKAWFCKYSDPIMVDITTLGIQTGMRIQEILDLKTKDVDWNKGYIRVWKNKTDLPRSIPMSKEVQTILRIRQNKIGEDNKFFSDYNYHRIQHQWERMQKDLGFDDATLHTLRHTFCSRAIQAGVELTVIQKLAGHKDIKNTLIYAHLANSNFEDAINKVFGR